jgi:GNAT superfamily N-acetyltransferase
MKDCRIILVDPARDADYVTVVADLLHDCANDLKESHGGHVPDAVVEGVIQRTYTTPASIRETFASTAWRFCAVDAGGTVLGTVLVAKEPGMLLVEDSANLNIPVEPTTLRSKRLHHIFNLAVVKQHRRQGVARRLISSISTEFRSLLPGTGFLARCEPPEHTVYMRFGFTHLPEYDVFLPEGVLLPTQFRSAAEYNASFSCACVIDARAGSLLASRKLKLRTFVKDFDA